MKNELRTQAKILFGALAVLWLTELVDIFLFGGALNAWGILPRHLIGLRGIVFAPFLHGGLGHVAANTIPFLTLGWLVMARRTADIFPVTVIVMLFGGLGVWVFGRPAVHLGASGVIFGYLGFLLLRGWFERTFGSMVFSLIIGVLYGGMIWGVLPGLPGVSWEAHLFGFLAGAFAARVLAARR
ncbi:MAG: rhomboid family intramembrane serine protease [Candidatus Lernaella stagnicola]|nr:rhomboid family intramembrane serine protease [Candidatus Lernaella stagnicola]